MAEVDLRTQTKEFREEVSKLPRVPSSQAQQLRSTAEAEVRSTLEGLQNPQKVMETRNLFLLNAVAQLESPESPFRQLMTALLPKQNMEFAEIRKAQQEVLRLKAATENLLADTDLKRALIQKAKAEAEQLKKNEALEERKLKIAETASLLNYFSTALDLYFKSYMAQAANIGLFNQQYLGALEMASKLATASKEAPKDIQNQITVVTRNLFEKLGLPGAATEGFLFWKKIVETPPNRTYQQMWEGSQGGMKPPPVGFPEGAYSPTTGLNPGVFGAQLQGLLQTFPRKPSEDLVQQFYDVFNQLKNRSTKEVP